jgi:hypothetical protein
VLLACCLGYLLALGYLSMSRWRIKCVKKDCRLDEVSGERVLCMATLHLLPLNATYDDLYRTSFSVLDQNLCSRRSRQNKDPARGRVHDAVMLALRPWLPR